MKTRVMAIAVLVTVLAVPAALHAQETDPAAVVSAVYDAFNAGDVDALAALYADDAVVEFPDWGDTYTGAEEVDAWVEELVASHFAVEIETLQVDGDTVTARIKAWADPSRALGIAPLISIDVYTVADGKITSQTSTLTDESAEKLQAAMAALPQTGGPSGTATLPAWLGIGGLLLLALGLGMGLRRASGRAK